MKTIPIIIILVLFSCNAQEKKTTQKHTEMTTETFDIETFEKNKLNGEYNFVLEDGTKIRQTSSDNSYSEYITHPKPELFMTFKGYYKRGRLKRYVIRYPNNFQKIRKEYDKQGKLIEEIDYDKPFKFTFEQLLELIKKEKDTIDLYDKNTSIGRGSDEEGTVWFVTYKKNWGRREVIKIDGITGQILERSHYPHEDN